MYKEECVAEVKEIFRPDFKVALDKTVVIGILINMSSNIKNKYMKTITKWLVAAFLGAVIGNAATYDLAISGPPPCVDAPWAEQVVNGNTVTLNLLSLDQGTCVKTWLLNVDPLLLDSLVVTEPTGNFDVVAETGRFTTVGRTFNVCLEFSVNIQNRFESGWVSLTAAAPLTVDRTSMIHIVGQGPQSGCGYDSVWIGIAPSPTAAKLLSANWVVGGKKNVITWKSGVEFNCLGYRVRAITPTGEVLPSPLIPASGSRSSSEYHFIIIGRISRVELAEIDLYGGYVPLTLLDKPIYHVPFKKSVPKKFQNFVQ